MKKSLKKNETLFRRLITACTHIKSCFIHQKQYTSSELWKRYKVEVKQFLRFIIIFLCV